MKDNVPPDGNIYTKPSIAEQSHLGYKITSIELDREWTGIVQQHTKVCQDSNFLLDSAQKNGFELIDTYKCDKCQTLFKKRGTMDGKKSNKVGRTSSYLNQACQVAMYSSAISSTKMHQFCSEVGLVHPTASTTLRNNKVLKKEILNLSEKQLKFNRKEHCEFVRSQKDYKGDIVVKKKTSRFQ